ncbi:hypothetical protein Aspvir_007503 [Aspergillus viridinutans]|uniref:Uncharacterized protein n=1 Tax=Aspergillus viridinutans TaxID=75553 RepID=A0A9P3F3B2_ASPVI|nr:uncharacterized protein Aspvir_007503 [Aspergillus viridinutans]GIK03434.1 hypothetical protein Aspvir_007503 [Aspergillus viridinutans]
MSYQAENHVLILDRSIPCHNPLRRSRGTLGISAIVALPPMDENSGPVSRGLRAKCLPEGTGVRRATRLVLSCGLRPAPAPVNCAMQLRV